MSGSNVKEFEVDIEVDVVTAGGLAEIVNSILELLLHQRSQIDLVYKKFRSFVNEWKENDVSMHSTESMHGYMLERQRQKAIQTKDNISAMRELIANTIENHVVKSLRFLFGSTTSTPKEVYTIHLPKISKLHMHEYHPNINLNQLLLSLLTRGNLDGCFGNNLCPTNLYLELEIIETPNNVTVATLDRVFPSNEKVHLPKSCKDIHFHLRHKPPPDYKDAFMNCCRTLKIFDDEICLKNQTELYGDLHQIESSFESANTSTWWESDIIVRGFREKLIKGHSIFSRKKI